MKNKKIHKKIIITLCALIIIALSITGGYTYSKYRTQVYGTAVMEVARWVFVVNGSPYQMHRIDLTSTCKPGTLVGNKIAPGTKGEFEIVIETAKSETAIEYEVKFDNETSLKPQNLYFSCDGVTTNSIQELEKVLTGVIEPTPQNEDNAVIKKITWEWKYETGDKGEIVQHDVEDTDMGVRLTRYSFDIMVIGTQVDPRV